MQTQAQNIAAQIANLLQNKSVTFAQVQYTTQVATAAAHKHVTVLKHTNANVQLFSNVSADVYANAVKRSAAKQAQNDPSNVQQFTSSSNYFAHEDYCYSIVKHKTKQTLYLYCIYNNAQSYYTIDGVQATKQQVAQLLTASKAQELLTPSTVVHNKTHNITHEAVVRTIMLQNITSIHAAKQQVVF